MRALHCLLPYPSISVLNKPANVNCVNCVPQQGCVIYESRPGQCRDFYCGFMVMKDLGEEWRPSNAGFIILMDSKANQIRLLADAEDPKAWRKEPYLAKIKAWSVIGLPHGTQVMVLIDDQVIVILPDREVNIGKLASNEVVVIKEIPMPGGIAYDAVKLRADDPRAIAQRRPSPFAPDAVAGS